MKEIRDLKNGAQFKEGIEHFIKSVRDRFINRTSLEPQGFVSNKFLVHIEPFTNLTVRIVLEDQCGFDEGELESNQLAFKGDDDLIYSPWIRLGLELPSKEQLQASDFEIISIDYDHNQITLDGYSVDEDLIGDEGIKTLSKWIMEDLKFLQNLPYLYPVDLLKNHKNFIAEPFMSDNFDGLAHQHGLKNFETAEDLERDLQSFLCQYAGSIIALNSIESGHLNYSVDPLTLKFKFRDEDCDVSLGLNKNPPELLECSLSVENKHNEITLQLGKKDLEDYSETFSKKMVTQFSKNLNKINAYNR